MKAERSAGWWMMVVLSIVLRERGSPESKPVASSHRHTGR